MTVVSRKRYFFNNHTKPGSVAISTKQFEMCVLYQGARFVPNFNDFTKNELAENIYGYHTFDIECTDETHAKFELLHSGKIHAVATLTLTEVEGEVKWEPTSVKTLS